MIDTCLINVVKEFLYFLLKYGKNQPCRNPILNMTFQKCMQLLPYQHFNICNGLDIRNCF